MALAFRDCIEELKGWKPSEVHRQESLWARGGRASAPTNEESLWAHGVRNRYDSPQRVLRLLAWHASQERRRTKLEKEFYHHAEQWKAATGHLSSISRTLAHPAYLRIIGLATQSTRDEIVRLLLRELRDDPDHWFAALTAITGVDPVNPEHDLDQSIADWLSWGKQKGLI